jgi:hypothetical protein
VTGIQPRGVPLERITVVSQPAVIAFNRLGHLLVASAATNQVFEVCLGPPPAIFSVTGTSVFSGSVPGATGGARFAGIVGVGSDRFGQLYVAENRSRLDARVSYFQDGIEVWSVQSIGSINIAEPDPRDGDAGSWYSVTNRMTFDAASGAWQEAAVTLNLNKYPTTLASERRERMFGNSRPPARRPSSCIRRTFMGRVC